MSDSEIKYGEVREDGNGFRWKAQRVRDGKVSVLGTGRADVRSKEVPVAEYLAMKLVEAAT